MLKLLIKLAIAAAIANAAWRVGSAYLTYYRFKDAIADVALFSANKTTMELRQRVVEIASQYDIPLGDDAFSVRRDDRHHTYVDGSYTQVVDLLPGYPYPWNFAWHVDVLTIQAGLPEPSAAR